MLIKCPNCDTSYNVPGEKIGLKPVKMRCHQCKQVFTVTRKNEGLPKGYEEYAGRDDALPGNFAFLREAQNENPKAEASQEWDDAAEYSSKEEALDEPATFIGVPPAPMLAASIKAAQTAGDSDATQPVPRPKTQSDSFDIYDSRLSAWENAVPLELEDYAANNQPTETDKTRFIGKLMTLVVGVLVLLFLLFGFLGNWSLGFSNSAEQIDDLPEPIRTLEAVITDKTKLTTIDDSGFVLISGRIFNNASDARTNVILRAGFRDPSGKLISHFEAPCGHVIDKKSLVSLPSSEWDRLYETGGKAVSCDIAPQASADFELPVVKPDSGCEHDSCDLEVKAVFAEIL